MRHTTFEQAMRSQPAVLAQLERSLRQQLPQFPRAVHRWQRGDTVALLAMGAAHHSSLAFAQVLRASGIRAVELAAASLGDADAAALGDHALVITESGRSPEPIAAVQLWPQDRRLAITNDPSAGIGDVVDTVIGLGDVDDSRAYTVGYTALLLAYEALAASLGIDGHTAHGFAESVAEALTAFEPVAAEHAAALAGASFVEVIGTGMSVSSAHEIALLIRETMRIPATGYEHLQYRHGPREAIRADSVVILVGVGLDELAAWAAAAGAHAITIGAGSQFDTGDREGLRRCAAEVIAAQLLVHAAGAHLPFSLDDFRNTQQDTKV